MAGDESGLSSPATFLPTESVRVNFVLLVSFFVARSSLVRLVDQAFRREEISVPLSPSVGFFYLFAYASSVRRVGSRLTFIDGCLEAIAVSTKVSIKTLGSARRGSRRLRRILSKSILRDASLYRHRAFETYVCGDVFYDATRF